MADFSIYGGASKEWLAVQATLPAPAANLTPVQLRDATNATREAISAKAMEKLSSKVEITDYAIPTRDGAHVDARFYWPAGLAKDSKPPVYFHLHGGGYLFGTIPAEDATGSTLALNTKVPVFNVNYRHTPEFTYPTCFDDVEDAFVWLHEHIDELGVDPERVVMGGISAGAHLTIALALQQNLGKLDALSPGKKLPALAGLVLMIPPTVFQDCYGKLKAQLKDPSLSSLVENEFAPVLPVSVMQMFFKLLKVEKPDPNDLRLSPGNAEPEQVKGLPPSVFGICGLDPLRDEGLFFAKLLTEADVPTNINVFKGVPHGFARFGENLKVGKAWHKVFQEGILWTLSKPAATGKFDVTVYTEDD